MPQQPLKNSDIKSMLTNLNVSNTTIQEDTKALKDDNKDLKKDNQDLKKDNQDLKKDTKKLKDDSDAVGNNPIITEFVGKTAEQLENEFGLELVSAEEKARWVKILKLLKAITRGTYEE